MPFEKDNWNGNKEGRPTGSKNTKSIEWENLKVSILNEQTTKFNQELNKLSGKDYCDMFLKVLQYFKPRMQHSRIEDIAPATTNDVKLTRKQIDKVLDNL